MDLNVYYIADPHILLIRVSSEEAESDTSR